MSQTSWWPPRKWPVGAFYAWAVGWLTVLTVLALAYGFQAASTSATSSGASSALGTWFNDMQSFLAGLPHVTFSFGDVLPLWVPWAGALGGAAISLVGVTEHGRDWDGDKYAYWHLARPALGAVFGVIGVLALVLVLQAISPETKNGLYTQQGAAVLAVFAFLLGYREETFRELVKRVVDTFVKPGLPSPAGMLTLSPTVVEFGSMPSGSPRTRTLTVVNRTTSSLEIKPGQIVIDPTTVTHALAAPLVVPAGSDATLDLTWTPTAAASLDGRITISTAPSELTSRLVGVAT